MKNLLLLLIWLLSATVQSFSQHVGIGVLNPTKAILQVHDSKTTQAIFGGLQGVSVQQSPPGLGFNSYFSQSAANHVLLTDGTAAQQIFYPTLGAMGFDMTFSASANQTPSKKRALTLFYGGRASVGTEIEAPTTLYVDRGNPNSNFDGTAVFAGTIHRSHFNYSFEENTYIRAGKDNGTVFINDIPGAKVAVGGLVGINVAIPNYTLEINQLANGIYLRDPNTNVGYEHRIANGGMDLYRHATFIGRFNQWGEYSYVSDRRVKKNIQPLSSLMEKLMRLNPVSYEMIEANPDHQRTFGLIAQEVRDLFPELVEIANNTASGYKDVNDIHSIKYGSFTPIMIKAIQEQQQSIENLNKKLLLLEQQVQSLLQLSTK